MSDADPISAYLKLAEKVFKHEVKLTALSAYIPTLPTIDRELLDRLAEVSEKASLSQPHMSWAICCVAEKASRQQKLDLFTRSLAAWYLGRAANRWVQPHKIAKAIARARRGFAKLGDAGWVAACDWMANDIPWVSENLVESEKVLLNSNEIIKSTSCSEFVPHILLALAQTQIMLEKLDEANSNIMNSEKIFIEKGDVLNQAICWMHQANCFRRQNQFSKALTLLEKSENIFISHSAILEIGKNNYYFGLTYLFCNTDYSLITRKFKSAIKIFNNCKLGLWKGMCLTFLGVVNMQWGQNSKASKFYLKAESIYRKFNNICLLAENLTAQGKLYILLGFPDYSIAQLIEARFLHRQLGRTLSAHIDSINIGEVYNQQGRYQDALHEFERVLDYFSNQEDKVRLGLLHIYLANYWINLQNYDFAENQLKLAESHLVISKQIDSLITINNSRARIHYEQGYLDSAQLYLENSLELAQKERILPQIALTELSLGDLLISKKSYSDALPYINEALTKFESMDMLFEISACLISKGICLEGESQKKDAKYCYKKALINSSRSFKELDWRAYAGLANLTDNKLALKYYRKAILTLSSIRSNIFQPKLAGTYAQKPKSFINQAITFASVHGKPEDVITFIEAEKTSSLRQQFNTSQNVIAENTSLELEEIVSEIDLIKKQISLFKNNPSSIKTNLETQKLHKELHELSEIYDEMISKLERKNLFIQQNKYSSTFSLNNFIKAANNLFCQKWIVLDYFLTDKFLFVVIINPNECLVKTIPLNTRLLQLLKICHDYQNESLNTNLSLAKLGQAILPMELLENITPDTTLIIAPHQELHGLPWAALGNQPLVQKCIPLIIPSLNSYQLIQQRSRHRFKESRYGGLIIGISEFEGRYPNLVNVQEEIDNIFEINIKKEACLFTNVSTFSDLKEIIHNKQNQNNYKWFHLATHFFYDTKTGRIGGFALKEEDIRLDQLRTLAPFPPLIILSGCSSLYSRIFASDEQISLSNTCFLAGADSLIGSCWPIPDTTTTTLMANFYKNLNKQYSPSFSLALAQRKAISDEEDFISWGSFLCLGIY